MTCGSATACLDACSSDLDCAAGNYCANPGPSGTCTPKLGNGAVCAASNQCTSGNCVDGVCCDTACAGLCHACVAAKTGMADGTCAVIQPGTDPDGECADQGAASCGTNGVCGAGGVCALYANGTQCVAPSCTNGEETHAASCNGAGTCATPTTMACAPYGRGNAACKTICSTDTDCAADNYCKTDGSCTAKLAQGSACLTSHQCLSGNCIDGFCCNNV